MKKLLIMTVLCTVALHVNAQFTGTSTISCTGCTVGLSTTSPQATLDLGNAGTQNNYHYPLFWYNDNFSGPYHGSKGGVYLDQWGLANNTTFAFTTASANPGTLIFASKETSVNDASSLTPRMTIAGQTGNVGIGTTSPQYKLDVGPVSVSQAINSGAAGLIRNSAGADMAPYTQARLIVYGGSAVDMGNWGYFAYGSDASMREVYAKTGSGAPLFWGTSSAMDGTGTFTPTMALSPNGNLGIGTTDDSNWQLANSSYKLAVGGSVIATAVTVKLRSAWPDYVFQPKYILKPLSEIKTYIDQNHHLPGMPSAEKIEKDGLDLGEMNKLLTKKVEELTLYLIEKDKEVKEQNAVINEMKQQINAIVKTLKKQ
ncbi:hypothetical protein KXQ82_10375 [Mucilaginibacter sp. HMF5004]|uniref:hypothetical protein n=1 Tax=Mucilaginibacter rivuli TaxID=2857527 RepID=UPI001C605D46|nr:hypothetical protein [Mucilaginibacter rivuli]MBW4890124.1 hypothetical protein [Mucilaginibacter rivuli]